MSTFNVQYTDRRHEEVGVQGAGGAAPGGARGDGRGQESPLTSLRPLWAPPPPLRGPAPLRAPLRARNTLL